MRLLAAAQQVVSVATAVVRTLQQSLQPVVALAKAFLFQILIPMAVDITAQTIKDVSITRDLMRQVRVAKYQRAHS